MSGNTVEAKEEVVWVQYPGCANVVSKCASVQTYIENNGCGYFIICLQCVSPSKCISLLCVVSRKFNSLLNKKSNLKNLRNFIFCPHIRGFKLVLTPKMLQNVSLLLLNHNILSEFMHLYQISIF